MSIFLKRTSSMYRPLYFDGKQIANYIFYNPNNEEILLTISQGWIENEGGGFRDLTTIELPSLSKKLKLDLKSKQPFYMLYKPDRYDYSRESKYTIYIPSNLVDLKFLGSELEYESEEQKTYYKKFSFKLICSIRDDEEPKLREIKVKQFDYTEDTEYKWEIDQYEEFLKAKEGEIDRSTLKKILKHYKLTKK